MRVNHEQVKFFFVVFMVNGGNKHSAGFNAHHRARRKVYYRNTGLAHKVFGFIVSVNARKNGALGARAVVKREFEQFFGLGNGFARKHFNRAEIGFRECLKINGVLKQRLYLNFGKVFFLFDCGRGLCGCRGLFGLLVRVKRFKRGDSDRSRELSRIIKHLRAFSKNKTAQTRSYQELSRIPTCVCWCNFWCKCNLDRKVVAEIVSDETCTRQAVLLISGNIRCLARRGG